MPERYEVLWAQIAEEDLIEIAEFIAAENVTAAKNSSRRLKKKPGR